MDAEMWDAIVVGAGQSGPSLAVRLAKAGYKTALIERTNLGGTCVNNGCTPTKTLVASARVAHLARRASDFGVKIESPVSVDYPRVHERMRAVVDQSIGNLTRWIGGTEHLSLIHGHARFSSPTTITVGERALRAPMTFLNVGCRPIVPDWALNSGVPYLTNESLLELTELPEHLAIVGGSYVGLEFAQAFRRFGSKVTVIEQNAALLQREDPEAVKEVQGALESDGVQFEIGACCFTLEPGKNGRAVLTFEREGSPQCIDASHVLLAVGRQPNTDDLGVEAVGLKRDARGYLVVDGELKTSVPGIWAMGDVNGRGAFTHTSWNDYEVVAANVLDGESRSIDGRVPPYALYIDPPLARIGDSERQARERGRRVLVGTMPMARVGRARERSETRGFMKVLVDADTMCLMGATFMCIDGDEVMHSMLNVMAVGADIRKVAQSVPIHPTISELIPTMLQQLKPL
ncbi:MAG TPA: FAD-containing oxidoreductase [Burkholderiaceae bacterium]|jgi:pyruvate/2-oxoglutarate dehydrogenase complex dihydrolipoamide dehydrogenase (E3) component|nr:FAD-containing oxidoreductase [Burkholderiaceae bacterium]